MELAKIKKQLEHLETSPTAVTHCNGIDLAYFIPAQIAELVAAVESLTAEKEAVERELARITTRLTEYKHESQKHIRRESDLKDARDRAESSLAQAREEIAKLEADRAGLWKVLADTQEEELAAEQREKGLVEDAERWRAIIGCARVRALGSAGIMTPNKHGYAHIGVELWTHHTASSEPEAIEWLTKFADIAKAALAAASKEEVGRE